MTIKEMNRIKEERGYSFDLLASYSGLPRATVVNVLTGASASPRKSTLAALDKVFSGAEIDFPGKRVHYGLNSRDPAYRYSDHTEQFPVSTLKDAPAPCLLNQQVGSITAEEFMHMELDYPAELINGRIVRRAEPDFIHSEICEYFYDTFKDYIKEHKGKCRPKVSNTNVILPPEDGRESVVFPDFFVLCREDLIEWYGIKGAPDFILEVVSRDNRKNDYVVKSAKYSACGVREYWILDPIKKILVTNIFDDTDSLYSPHMQPLTGKAGVHIYNDDLTIDLDEIRKMIESFTDKQSN